MNSRILIAGYGSVFAIVLPLLGYIPHVADRHIQIDQASYRPSEIDAAKESIALSLLGQLQLSVGDLMWLKSMEYLHLGQTQRMPTRAEEEAGFMRTDSLNTAVGMGHTEGVNMTLDRERDWRGFIGEVERHVKPYQPEHRHDDPVELIPWYQLAVKLNPRLERLYTLGAFYMADFAQEPAEAKELLEAGLQANPDSFEIRAALGRLFVEYADNLAALEHEHEDAAHDDEGQHATYDPQSAQEAYELAAQLLTTSVEYALRDLAALAKQRETFDELQKQVHGEAYLFLAQALTELGRYYEAIEMCDQGTEVTHYALLKSQKRIVERRLAGEATADDAASIVRELDKARRPDDDAALPHRGANRTSEKNSADRSQIMPPLWHTLRVAIEYGDSELDTVQKFLSQDPTLISQPDSRGELPTHCATRHEAVEILRFLVENQADVNATDPDGASPLHVAARFGKVRSAETLIELGANPNSLDSEGLAPIHIAAKYGRLELVRLLAGLGSVDQIGGVDRTPLHIAAMHDQREVIKGVLDLGADINRPDGNQTRTIHFLLQCFRPIVLDPVKDPWSNTSRPEINAHTKDGTRETLDLLLRHGAEVNAPDGVGFYPIHYAVWSNDPKIVDAILDAGARTDQPGPSGILPVELSINPQIRERVMNAATTSTTLNGAIVLGDAAAAATLARNLEVLNPLLPNPFVQASTLGEARIVHSLAEAGLDINAVGPDGRTPLLHAVECAAGVESIHTLIEAGADPNVAGGAGDLPLILAVKDGDAKVARILLEAGVNVDGRDQTGDTALTVAAKAGAADMVGLLIEFGGDPDVEDGRGRSARRFLRWRGDVRETIGEVGASDVESLAEDAQ